MRALGSEGRGSCFEPVEVGLGEQSWGPAALLPLGTTFMGSVQFHTLGQDPTTVTMGLP